MRLFSSIQRIIISWIKAIFGESGTKCELKSDSQVLDFKSLPCDGRLPSKCRRYFRRSEVHFIGVGDRSPRRTVCLDVKRCVLWAE